MFKKMVAVMLFCALLCGCVGPTASQTVTATIPATTAPESATPTLPIQSQTAEVPPSPTIQVTDPEITVPQITDTPTVTVTAEPIITVTPSTTPTPAPTPTPTPESASKTVLEDFERGSANECVYSVDWSSVGFGFITNPVISVANVGFNDGAALKVKLPDSAAWAQNLIIKNDKVQIAFKNQNKYFRMYVSNQSGGSIGIGVALMASDGKKPATE